jgi:hypothetical protein
MSEKIQIEVENEMGLSIFANVMHRDDS